MILQVIGLKAPKRKGRMLNRTGRGLSCIVNQWQETSLTYKVKIFPLTQLCAQYISISVINHVYSTKCYFLGLLNKAYFLFLPRLQSCLEDLDREPQPLIKYCNPGHGQRITVSFWTTLFSNLNNHRGLDRSMGYPLFSLVK